jgi:hypothetical protein
MAISYQPCFVSTIIFDIKDKVDSDFLVPHWWFSLQVMTFVYKCVIVINFGEL